MLDDLPQELLLTVLANLCIPEIANVRSLSRAWHRFVAQNESAIFRAAAILEHGIPSSANSVLDILELYSPRALKGVSTWKDLCIRLTQIRKSWGGITPSTVTLHPYTGYSKVHRFKIDEKAGVIIATTSLGGITVTDLAASKWHDGGIYNTDSDSAVIKRSAILWTLPRNHVRPYAHCEYGHGYLIFDRFGVSKEVWRLAEYDYYYSQPSSLDKVPSQQPTVISQARPDARQWAAFNFACQYVEGSSEDDADEEGSPLMISPRKGSFVPWALLFLPTPTRAFRFVYPFLLVVSFESAYLYDVRTGVMVQKIRDIQNIQSVPGPHSNPPPPILGELYYVEHSPYHVFICGDACLQIFSRQTGQCVYHIPAIYGNYGRSRWMISRQRENMSLIHTGCNDPVYVWERIGSALYQHEMVREEDRWEQFVDRFLAVHVSRCGNYLAVMLETSRVLIIRDLDRIVKGELSLLDSTIEVQLGISSRFSRYLAFENGRVAVASRNGIFIVIPHSSFFNSAPLSTSPPPIVLRVRSLNDPLLLETITCLQMTQTGLFVNWSPTCPLAMGIARVNDSNEMYMAYEKTFWNGLNLQLAVAHQVTGNAFIVEDELSEGPMVDSVVLSVDFVPT